MEFAYDRPMTRNDVPLMVALMMDKCGITEFKFTIEELLKSDLQVHFDTNGFTGECTVQLERPTNNV